MNDQIWMIPANWLDWLAVFGYIAVTVFIAWRVFTTKPK
jgi:hypothetical protein